MWALILGVATAVEVDGIRHPGAGGTLSEVTRRAWRTSTPTGRALFTVAWAAFAGWFVVHITAGDGSSSTS